ncbi:MAG: hypothetical protein CSA94_01695 [Bacteroidetes bacterium]|nr:MAG: hypothetical protein CSA94_01695 [Bacteroidota bacterium]
MRTLILAIVIISMVACKHSHNEGHNHSEEEHQHEHPHTDGHNHDEHDHDHDGHDHNGDDLNHDGHSHEAETQDGHNHSEEEIHLTAEQLKSAKVKIGQIEKRMMREHIEVTGSIEAPPQSKATIHAPLEAFVYETNLLLGDKVKKGQVIAVLQHPNFTNLQYNYLEAVNKLKVAEQEFKRKAMLFKNDIVSQKDYQLTESSYKSAQSLVQNYSSQLKMAGLSPQKIEESGIQQYVYVQSPIGGYIVKNNLNKGKFLSANAEMMEIIDNEHMHAELNVFSSDIDRLSKGDAFIFRPNGTDKEYEGYIKLISQRIDNQSKTINVHGHFKDEQRSLKVGTFINAQILLGGDSVYTVPEDAIVEFEGKKVIFKAENENTFLPLDITIGNTDRGFVALKSIHDDNFNIRIITEGAHFLKGELLKSSGEMDGHGHAH